MNPALAATSKMLKTVTALRFANRRTFSIAPEPTWLAKSKLTPTDRRQLIAIVGSYGDEADASITLERAMTTAPEALFTGVLQAFAESPLEWFDVFDQDDVVQFQLWLYGARAGTLFKAATTTGVAPIDDRSFRAAGRGLDEATAERLAALLRKAKKIAASLHPKSDLASVTF
jgi:hypothetical protein